MITALASQGDAAPPDSLRRAIADVFAGPEYRWADSRVILRWLGTQWQTFLDWLNAFQRSHPTQYAVLLAVAVALLVAILVHFAYIAVRILRPTLSTGPTSAAAGQPVNDVHAHLGRATDLAVAGRYAEALAHRFLALLLQLDARRAIKFHVSKTPAEGAPRRDRRSLLPPPVRGGAVRRTGIRGIRDDGRADRRTCRALSCWSGRCWR